jgi:hypothetical protein
MSSNLFITVIISALVAVLSGTIISKSGFTKRLLDEAENNQDISLIELGMMI